MARKPGIARKVGTKLGPWGRALVVWKVLWDPRTSVWGKALFLVVSAAYLLSPVDLLPEILLGPFGLLDDALVLGILATLVAKLAPKPVQQEAEDEVRGRRKKVQSTVRDVERD